LADYGYPVAQKTTPQPLPTTLPQAMASLQLENLRLPPTQQKYVNRLITTTNTNKIYEEIATYHPADLDLANQTLTEHIHKLQNYLDFIREVQKTLPVEA